jgi:hypothetical protein
MATTKVTTDVIDMSGNTGGLVWAKGATGDQPAVVDSTAGDLRENTTTFKTAQLGEILRKRCLL